MGLSEYTKLKYLGNCHCGQCQLVPMSELEAAIQRYRLATDLLRWMEQKGGLGLDVHERIRAVLDSIEAPE